MDEYNQKLGEYTRRRLSNDFLFDVAKCCGYSEIVSEYKTSSCGDLHRTVSRQFDNNAYSNLYAVSCQTGEKIAIPSDHSISLKTFIVSNQIFFTPMYPLPASVVYKLLLHESCGHNHSNFNFGITGPSVPLFEENVIIETNVNKNKNQNQNQNKDQEQVIQLNIQSGNVITLRISIE